MAENSSLVRWGPQYERLRHARCTRVAARGPIARLDGSKESVAGISEACAHRLSGQARVVLKQCCQQRPPKHQRNMAFNTLKSVAFRVKQEKPPVSVGLACVEASRCRHVAARHESCLHPFDTQKHQRQQRMPCMVFRSFKS
jgi:hypothetical protein